MFSIWEKETLLARADHLIIGGGITGLNAAIRLKGLDPAARVVVVEKHPWGGGASYRNAGFACMGSPTELIDDLGANPEELVWEIFALRWQGLQRLLTKVPASVMQLQWCGGAELFPDTPDCRWEEAADRLGALNARIRDITGEDRHFEVRTRKEDFRSIRGIIAIAREGRLHPGRMMQALRDLATGLGVALHTGVEVEGLEPAGNRIDVKTKSGQVLEACRVGIATNGFTPDWYVGLPLRPARNQVYLTSPVPGLAWDRCLHMHSGYVYARRVGERILIGGGRHLDPEGESVSAEGLTTPIRDYLTGILESHLLQPGTFQLEMAWSGTMGVGESKHPIIRELEPGISAAVRLGGMGVAIGTLTGEALAESMVRP